MKKGKTNKKNQNKNNNNDDDNDNLIVWKRNKIAPSTQ